MKAKFPPAVYEALSKTGMSNREIARQLGVSEAAVRRGLVAANGQGLFADKKPKTKRQFLVTVEEL